MTSGVESSLVGLNPQPVESDSISRTIVSELGRIVRHTAGVQKLFHWWYGENPPHTQTLEMGAEFLAGSGDPLVPSCWDHTRLIL